MVSHVEKQKEKRIIIVAKIRGVLSENLTMQKSEYSFEFLKNKGLPSTLRALIIQKNALFLVKGICLQGRK
jgi:hypothetical protein